MKLHEKIKAFMDANGIKQSHVANKSGFNPKTFNAIFHNRRKMTADEFESICVLGLGVSPAYFFDNRVLDSKNKNPNTAA